MPDYGVEAIWRKPGRPGCSERVPRVPFICADDHWTSWKWEQADPEARETEAFGSYQWHLRPLPGAYPSMMSNSRARAQGRRAPLT